MFLKAKLCRLGRLDRIINLQIGVQMANFEHLIVPTRLLYSLSSEVEGSMLPDWRFSFKKLLLGDRWQVLFQNHLICINFKASA